MDEIELTKLKRQCSLFQKLMIGFGIIAIVTPIYELIDTIARIVRAFDKMGMNEGADPAELAGEINSAMATTAGGTVITLSSIILFTVFLILFLTKKKQLEPTLPPLPGQEGRSMT